VKYIFKIYFIIISLLLYSCSSSENIASESDKELMVTFQDSLSYAMGISIAGNLPNTEINQELLIEGLEDYWNKENPRLDISTRNDILRAFNIMSSQIERDKMQQMGEKSRELSRENKIKGQEFLDNNKVKEGVKVFNRSQIQYRIIATGKGEIPEFDDTVIVHYNGFLIDGYKFDSSYDRGQPATFGVKSVIVGWQEVLQKMPVGSKWEVFIPQNLGYGTSGVPSDVKKGEYVIPPSSTLIFEIELLGIVK
jgi:FKBP-type peptidyl-prolyl cis-trans isomerase